MKSLLESQFGIRKEERVAALLMTGYHFTLLVTLYLLKPARDSLFLTERGPLELPLVYMLTSVVVIPMALWYARAGRRRSLGLLIHGTTAALVASLVGLRVLVGFALDYDLEWAYYVLYAWVSIYGVLVTSQFWLFANDIFDASGAKRTFSLLSLGAILGAIVGGELTSLLVEQTILESRDLILLAAALLTLSSGFVWMVMRRRNSAADTRSAPSAPEGLLGIVKVLRSSSHLMLIVGVIVLAVLTTTIVDYEFKTLASQHYGDTDELSSFMGRFYSRVSIAALVVQAVLAPRIIQWLGAGAALLVLPTALAAGTAGLFLLPGLTTATILRGIDQSLKHSVDKTGRELLFLPVAFQTKKRVKVFIDLFMDHGAQGLGGLLLLILAVVLGMGVREISIVLGVLLCLWVGLVLLARYSYVDKFRESLEHQVQPDDADEEPTGEERTRQLGRQLASDQPEEIGEGLELLESSDEEVHLSTIQRLLDHEDAEVRRQAIRVLRKRELDGLVEPVADRLDDEEMAVRLEAARYIYRDLDEERRALVERGLGHPDREVQALVVGFVAKEGTPVERSLVSDRLVRELAGDTEGEADEESRLQVARVLGVLRRPSLTDLLGRLIDDESAAVRKRAIRSAGQSGDRCFVHRLVMLLEDEEHYLDARDALGRFETNIIGTLSDYMSDPRIPERVRQRIPRVILEEEEVFSPEQLLAAAERVQVPVWHAIVRTLSEVREREEFSMALEEVMPHVEWELARYVRLGQATYVFSQQDGFDDVRLRQARTESLERIFRLLGLYYLHDDMLNTFRGLVSGDPQLEAEAHEFMDNILGWEVKQKLTGFLEDESGEQAAKEGGELLEKQVESPADALRFLYASEDPRLEVVAIEQTSPESPLWDEVERRLEYPHPTVRRAALVRVQHADDRS